MRMEEQRHLKQLEIKPTPLPVFERKEAQVLFHNTQVTHPSFI